MRFVAVLAVASALVVAALAAWPGASSSALSAPQQAESRLQVGPIIATAGTGPFSYLTRYTAQILPPGAGTVAYLWARGTVPGGPPFRDCGEFEPSAVAGASHAPSGGIATALWQHQHPPCPNEAVHPARITLLVQDARREWQCWAHYDGGSAAGTSAVPSNCVFVGAQNPPLPPEDPPPANDTPDPIAKQQHKEMAQYYGLVAVAGLVMVAIATGPVGVVVGIVFATTGSGVSVHNAAMANDPPDPNFQSIAAPRVAKHPRLTARQIGRDAAAVNAWVDSASRLSAYLEATVTSIERAQGARAAGDFGWVVAHRSAAARYAELAAAEIDKQPRLRRAASRVLAKVAGRRMLTRASVAALQRAARRGALPANVRSALRRIRATPKQSAAVRQAVLEAGLTRPVRASAALSGGPLTTAERNVARSLRALAARLRQLG